MIRSQPLGSTRSTSWTRISRIPLLSLAALLSFGSFVSLAADRALAQTGPVVDRRAYANRAELESLAAQTERDAAASRDARDRERKQAEATVIRDRLRDGDFQVGDRLTVTVDTALNMQADTFTVRAGRVVTLPEVNEVSLQGVLRSELQDYLTKQYARYLRNPTVKTTSLIRIHVLGAVGKPGFFSVPSDMLVTDVIMVAGGPGPVADINKSVVKRGTREVVSRKALQVAIVNGKTIDQLNLRAGDAIIVGGGQPKNWYNILQVVGFSVAIVGTLYGISRKF
ncbi:MAG: polysaccharide biosynthesis/export family protein [Gemmatimonadaceae bacterium]